MIIHAGQPDGKPVCGMNAAPEQLISIDLEGPINAKALGAVTCKSCLRIIAKRTGARPTPVAAPPKAASAKAAAPKAEPKARQKLGPKPKPVAAAEAPKAASPKAEPKARQKLGPKPKPVAASEAPKVATMTDEAIRAIVREEISLGIEQLLRKGEVADVLSVSKGTVEQLVDAKELVVVMVAKKKARITASSVEAYIRRQTV